MTRVALLVRVSTDKQDYNRQINELQEYCEKMNWEVVRIFANKVSGAKKIEERQELVDMLQYISENDIDKVCVWEISRLGRSTLEALKVIEMLNERKVCLYIKNYYWFDKFRTIVVKMLNINKLQAFFDFLI